MLALVFSERALFISTSAIIPSAVHWAWRSLLSDILFTLGVSLATILLISTCTVRSSQWNQGLLSLCQCVWSQIYDSNQIPSIKKLYYRLLGQSKRAQSSRTKQVINLKNDSRIVVKGHMKEEEMCEHMKITNMTCLGDGTKDKYQNHIRVKQIWQIQRSQTHTPDHSNTAAADKWRRHSACKHHQCQPQSAVQMVTNTVQETPQLSLFTKLGM